ncbi:flavin-containing monooxygenase [Eisenibacter elegans]|uniref:flavin-containing monooxygenase n=1 Tax=Eisenibacter elegans TaxID=997 RepID=UPI0004204E7A|nr:NAD(P)-binding domain-containing protein [Eisenibacter elegans]
MDTPQKVCIIGAGSSGIAAAKVLHEKGIPFDCYEKGSGIGGNWRYMNDNGMSSAYRSLHINTSRAMMAYSDFPMPDDYPDYPSHFQMLEYFESFVDRFGFRDKIIFNTGVADVKREADNSYTITTDKGNTERYAAVMVANGHHWCARYPEPGFPGTLDGTVMHSHDYKTPEGIFGPGKHVVVLGIGNSGVDIACEAARVGSADITIISRSGAYIFPKYIWGQPFDMLGKLNVSFLPLAWKRQLIALNLWLARGKQEDYGIPKPKRPLLSEHPTISPDLLHLAGHGRIKVRQTNIKELRGDHILLEDGTTLKADVLIYATGYKIAFPFFKEDFFRQVEISNNIQLYKRVVHPDYPNLYFIGLLQPLGAIMPLAEIQSEWIARVMTGEVALPSEAQMRKDIDAAAQKVNKQYKQAARHTIQVDFQPYINLIKAEMRKHRTGKAPRTNKVSVPA